MKKTNDVLVTSFEEACEKLGYDAKAILPDVSMFPEEHRAAITSYAKMIIISEAINEKHRFDWNDSDEYKWFPWFDMEVDDNNRSGFRFDGALCDYASTDSTGGSRLCFRTRAAAEHAGKTFIDYYRDMMVIQK
jgi:hypothetical protein